MHALISAPFENHARFLFINLYGPSQGSKVTQHQNGGEISIIEYIGACSHAQTGLYGYRGLRLSWNVNSRKHAIFVGPDFELKCSCMCNSCVKIASILYHGIGTLEF